MQPETVNSPASIISSKTHGGRIYPAGLLMRAYPDPALIKKCAPVDVIDSSLESIINDMRHLMKSLNGVGIAAPQVGILKRFFISGEKVIINPIIEETSKDRSTQSEGCLSIPGAFGNVTRPNSIKVRYYDLEGEEVNELLSGMEARIFQHEYDHLEGMLILHRMSMTHKLKAKSANKKYMKVYGDKMNQGIIFKKS